MKTNPFKAAERIGNVIGMTVFVAFAIFSIGVVGWSISDHFGLGWWGLLLIPGAPVALIILAIVAGLISLLTDTIHDRWLMAKWRWDDRHPPRTESTEQDPV